MRFPQLRLTALALAGGVALGGCAYGYDPYGGGYGGVSVGYGSSYGYGNPYGYGGYGGYPYGYAGYGYGGYGGYDPFGWYGDYYYPGSGVYVYDRHHHRRVMTDRERTFWTTVIKRTSGASTTAAATTNAAPRDNWSGFNRVRTRGQDVTSTSTSNDNRHWQNRTSETTPATSDTTPRTRPDTGWHRSRNRPQ